MDAANAALKEKDRALQTTVVAWQLAQYAAMTVTARLETEASARKEAEAALANAQEQVRSLNARLAAVAAGKKAGKPAQAKAQAEPARGSLEVSLDRRTPAAGEARPASRPRVARRQARTVSCRPDSRNRSCSSGGIFARSYWTGVSRGTRDRNARRYERVTAQSKAFGVAGTAAAKRPANSL